MATAGERPNVVFILTDDLGYADLGCMGATDIRTSNIDSLAKAGVRLTSAYSAAPVCSPTRAALITGRYPQRSGFEWVVRYGEMDRGLATTGRSLPQLLKDAGYATGLVGKWHLGYKPEWGPNAHGFGTFFGILAADADHYSHREATGEPGLYEDTKPIEQPGYLTDLITDRAEQFLRQQSGKPFFLEVAYTAPHWPFQRPDRPDDIRTKANYGPSNGTRADYIAMVERMDAGVGRILKTLESLGRTKDTIVIFTNDNGGERLSNNSPHFHGKYTLWEGGLRVPAIVRWPGVIASGTTCSQPTITMDWTATILAAANVDRPADLDGIDILPDLTAKRPNAERTLCWRLPRPEAKFGMAAVRRGNWKFVYDREMELLFDLDADPGERKNLASTMPERVGKLRWALDKWEADLPKVP